MEDPVICSDGFSYDRPNIEMWLAQSNKSPKTNLDLANNHLVPNHNLRQAIASFKLSMDSRK